MPSMLGRNIEEGVYRTNIARRHAAGTWWRRMFMASFGVAILALVLLLLTVLNDALGFVLINYRVQPETISDRPLTELTGPELVVLLEEYVPGQLVGIVNDNFVGTDTQSFIRTPMNQSMAGRVLPEQYAGMTPSEVPAAERPAVMGEILENNLNADQLRTIVETVVLVPEVTDSWTLSQGILNRAAIEQGIVEEYPDEITRPELQFRSWIRPELLTMSLGENPLFIGIRPALIGTLLVLAIVLLVGFPIGVMAAIYLEEYATKNALNRLIENNIRNLAGVPSIIYGMLGLQLFVRFLGAFTSGQAFLGDAAADNGRTVLSAGLTMSLLVLPVVIINAQEAIRSVPTSYREASFGLGATKWQTIWKQVLPASLPGMMTGLILSVSRAIGETAPLIVVGASAFLALDPNGPFSKYTVLPIQIYSWTTQPQPGFKELAAATIIVLMVLLVFLNLTAFVIRNRARRSLQS